MDGVFHGKGPWPKTRFLTGSKLAKFVQGGAVVLGDFLLSFAWFSGFSMGFIVILESFLLFKLEPLWRCFDIKYQKWYVMAGTQPPPPPPATEISPRSWRCKIAICSDAAEEARILGAEAHVSCRKLCSEQWTKGPLGSLGFMSGMKRLPSYVGYYFKKPLWVWESLSNNQYFMESIWGFFSWFMFPSSNDL